MKICEQLCNPMAEFDQLKKLSGVSTSDANEGSPRLTPDELEIYFGRLSSGRDNYDIYWAKRDRIDDSFPAVESFLTGVNSSDDDLVPSISSDGTTLYFESNRRSNEGRHLDVAIRGMNGFVTSQRVPNVNSSDMLVDDTQPFLTAEGTELWFA
jgi:Tol biopolymer transport system component